MPRISKHNADRRPAISAVIIEGMFQLADLAPKASEQSREMTLALGYISQTKSWFESDKKAAKTEAGNATSRNSRAKSKLEKITNSTTSEIAIEPLEKTK